MARVLPRWHTAHRQANPVGLLGRPGGALYGGGVCHAALQLAAVRCVSSQAQRLPGAAKCIRAWLIPSLLLNLLSHLCTWQVLHSYASAC
jgi:hypothetical protein